MSLIYQALKQSEQRAATVQAPVERGASQVRKPLRPRSAVRPETAWWAWAVAIALLLLVAVLVAWSVGFSQRDTAAALERPAPPPAVPLPQPAVSVAPAIAAPLLPDLPTMATARGEPPLPTLPPRLKLVYALPAKQALPGASAASPASLSAPTPAPTPALPSTSIAPARIDRPASSSVTVPEPALAVAASLPEPAGDRVVTSARPNVFAAPLTPGPDTPAGRAAAVAAAMDLATVFDGMNRALEARDRTTAQARLTVIQARLPAASVARLRAEAWFAHQTGDLDTARLQYRRLLDKSGGDELSAINLAAIEKKINRADQAKETIVRALRQNPDSAALHAAFDQLVQGEILR